MNGIAEYYFLEKSPLAIAESLEHTAKKCDLLKVPVQLHVLF